MQTKKVTIQVKDHGPVDCYGEWREDSNAACTFDDEFFDGIWADGAENWTQVANELAAYAKRNDTTLIEMEAC